MFKQMTIHLTDPRDRHEWRQYAYETGRVGHGGPDLSETTDNKRIALDNGWNLVHDLETARKLWTEGWTAGYTEYERDIDRQCQHR